MKNNIVLEDFNQTSWLTRWNHKLLVNGLSLNKWFIWTFLIPVPIAIYWLIATYTSLEQGFILVLFSYVVSWAMWMIFAGVQVTALEIYVDIGYRNGVNDDEVSVGMTADVIKNSKKWVAFYDYGEEDPYNIYSSSTIRDLLINKLDSDDDFLVSMVFAKPEDEVAKLPLLQALHKWQDNHPQSTNQVLIKYAPEKEHLLHYKINDTGHAFLTRHSPKESKRKFEYFTPKIIRPIDRVNQCLDFHNNAINSIQS